jgi:hypothetical protein
MNSKRNIQRNTQVLGYVPIQVVYLSLKELKKQMYIRVASPIQVNENQATEGYNVNTIRRETDASQGNFEEYLKEN